MSWLSEAWDDVTGQTAANTAAAQMNESTQQSVAMQQQYLDWLQTQSTQQQEALQPYQDAGLAALSQYQNLMDNPDALANDPTLQYLQGQGQQQVESSAAARGTQLSGRTLEGLAQTGQSIASQYRGQILGELSNLMNLGTGASTAGQGYANAMGAGYGSIADLYQQQGMTNAASTMGAYQGAANIFSGGLQAYGAAQCSKYIKENYTKVSPEILLSQVNELPIEEWNYIGETDVHVSPYAEDFHEVTGKGDGKTIPYIDMIGMLMGSVQALTARINELEAK